MTARTLTPQAISALLGRAGFDRSRQSKSRIKGMYERSPGFIVTKQWDGKAVRVESHPGTFNRGDAAQARADALLDRYAAAIREAGWTVTADDSWLSPRLIVTARKPEGG